MPTNVIPNGEIYSFGGRDLHGQLQEMSDTDEQDIAVHRPLKRDGAIVEGMGWNARRFSAKHEFVGNDFRTQVVDLRTFLRSNSTGMLVHPLYGRFNARCTKIEGALNIPQEANGTSITLVFIEDAIDPQSDAVDSQGVASKSQALSSQADVFETLSAIYESVAAVSATIALVAEAASFAAAALDVLTLGVSDPSLPLYVASIETNAIAAIAAISVDPAAESDPDRWDALAAADLVYASALDLAAAIASTGPNLSPYVVPVDMGYLAINAIFFGVDALDHDDEFLQNNPSIVTPHLIPTGTVLLMPPATV